MASSQNKDRRVFVYHELISEQTIHFWESVTTLWKSKLAAQHIFQASNSSSSIFSSVFEGMLDATRLDNKTTMTGVRSKGFPLLRQTLLLFRKLQID